MARPERNSIDYFPFICSEGKKMYYLEETYGNDGFAVFVKLLRELAKTEYHYLNLSEKTTLMFLSAKCKVTKEVLESIINDLVELGKFNKLLWTENKIIWCQDFIDSIQDAYNKRKNNCITYDGLLLLLISLGVRKQGKSESKAPVKPQSKVEYKKVEYKKTLLSELKDSDFYQKEYLDITIAFWGLFVNNLKEKDISTARIEKATGKWIDNIRLLIENDKYTLDDLREVFKFLQVNEFWKTNILSTSKLREKFEKLLLNARKNETGITKEGCTPEELAEVIGKHFAVD